MMKYNVWASKRIAENQFKKDNRVKAFVLEKERKGKRYLSLRINVGQDVKAGEWLNLVILPQIEF